MDVTRRRAISTALALLLAVESVTAVSAAASFALTPAPAAHALPAATPSGEVLAETGTADRAWSPSTAAVPTIAAPDTRDYATPRATLPVVKAAAKATTHAARPKTASHAAPRTTKPATKVHTAPRVTSFAGRNHMWIPSLGVSQSVSFFSCDRSAPPSNYVYRWGCAGSNNVYLLGHAYSVFKPLHDAYLNGRLVKGMKVYYADGSGVTHVYAVSWWKLTRPTTDASWAWASQAVPSMTLQTCMGANSEYRLMVRLARVG
jgi:hypothetical protein